MEEYEFEGDAEALGKINFGENKFSRLLATDFYNFTKLEDDSIVIADTHGFLVNKTSVTELINGLQKFLNNETTGEGIKKYNLENWNNQFNRENHTVTKQRKLVSGYVYFVKCNNKIKIGRSKNADKRIRIYGVVSPFKAETVHVIKTDDSIGLEKYFHDMFSGNRSEGEWFDLSSKDIKNICSGIYDNVVLSESVSI